VKHHPWTAPWGPHVPSGSALKRSQKSLGDYWDHRSCSGRVLKTVQGSSRQFKASSSGIVWKNFLNPHLGSWPGHLWLVLVLCSCIPMNRWGHEAQNRPIHLLAQYSWMDRPQIVSPIDNPIDCHLPMNSPTNHKSQFHPLIVSENLIATKREKWSFDSHI